MIPKVIHYCWFGGKPLSEQAIKCIDSWKKYCDEYEIIEWNESNFDIHCNQYVEEAYAQGKWAFVSDYARLFIVYNEGGFYFDTDVELIKCIDELRTYEAFFAQEASGMVNTGLGFAAEKGNFIVKLMLDEYEKIKFVLNSGHLDLLPCPIRNTKTLFELGYQKNRKMQYVMNVPIFSSDFFCPYDYIKEKTLITDNTYSIHHYEGSWDYPPQVREKYKIFYCLLGHHIGHFICEVGELMKNDGFMKTVRFVQYRIMNKIKKVWLSNEKKVYRKNRYGAD